MLSLFRSLLPRFLCPSAFLLLLSISLSFFLTTLAKNGRTKALIAKTRMDGPSEPASKHWVEKCKSAGRWTPPTRDRDPQANPVLYLKKKKASLWRPNMSPKVPHGFYITGFSTSQKWHLKPPTKLKTPALKPRTIVTHSLCHSGVGLEKKTGSRMELSRCFVPSG